MKKTYIILLCATTLFVGCNRDEKSLFDKSAAERAVEAVTNAENALVAAPYGWEMLYFANTESRGYHMLITFKENGQAIITAKNALTTGNKIVTDNESTWDLISDYGPVLSFNTYNTVLHAWADPRNDGDGYLGDYEFLVLSSSADELQLKGKKHSGYSVLRRLTEETSAADYFARVEAMDKQITGNGNLLLLTQGENQYTLHNSYNGIFYLAPKNEMYDIEELDIYPFIATHTGLHLMAGFLTDSDDREARDYVLKDGILVGKNATLEPGSMPNYFMNYLLLAGNKWSFSTTNTCSDLNSKIEKVNKTLTSINKKAGISSIMLIYNESKAQYRLEFSYTLNGKTIESPVIYLFDVKQEENSISMNYTKPLDLNAAKLIYNISQTAEQKQTGEYTIEEGEGNLPGLKDLILGLSGIYTIANNNGINPTNGSILTRSDNADIWYELTGVNVAKSSSDKDI